MRKGPSICGMPATQSDTMYAAFGRSLPPSMPLSLVAMRASEVGCVGRTRWSGVRIAYRMDLVCALLKGGLRLIDRRGELQQSPPALCRDRACRVSSGTDAVVRPAPTTFPGIGRRIHAGGRSLSVYNLSVPFSQSVASVGQIPD